MSFEHFNQVFAEGGSPEINRNNVESDPFVRVLVGQMQNIAEHHSVITYYLNKLPSDNSSLIETRIRAKGIYQRALDVMKGAVLSLSLLSANPALAQVESGRAVPETSDHVELRYDNPQREAYKSAEAYRVYLIRQIEKYEELRVQYPDMDRYAGRVVNSELEGLREEADALESDAEVGIDRAERMSRRYNSNYRPSIDSVRQSLADQVHSSEYAVKARAEGLTDEEIEKRRSRVKQDPVYITDVSALSGAEGDYHDTDEVFPEHLRDTVRVKQHGTKDEFEQTVVHELQHYITRGNEGLSQIAKDLYKEAFDSSYYYSKATSILHGRTVNEYLSDPTELDARRKEFERQFEQLTDWKYGQPFTSEHIKQAKQLLNEGKLGHGAVEFLNVIKPEYLERIMNTLADTGSYNRDSIEQTV